ncbi:hypothetical protein U1P98_09830 [Lysinibacillus irui]|uniref:Uncharacterized protein n=1 Tax=Lysinibacillus irui TaxID=2998077 RepID=A0ABU5NKM7_9BACI|nr:hypothetical protein [Lysinibacillus irui]MEA0554875.1 hypothetical protein [Lysinibacillus irui]MEA0976590.1 hypothetical protein [Lysinibacillus irui]MEA1042744.1 hypothetical protein [Lysinibacillus irui]
MKSRGRKKIEYEPDFIKKLIESYVEKYNLNGKLSYREMHEYVNALIANGEITEIDKPISIYYWRAPERQGRIMVDKYNEAFQLDILNYPRNTDSFETFRDIYIKLQKCDNLIEKNRLEKLITYKDRLFEANVKENKKIQNKLEELERIIEKKNEQLTFLNKVFFSICGISSEKRMETLNKIQNEYIENLNIYLNDNLFNNDLNISAYDQKRQRLTDSRIIKLLNKKD